MTLPAFAAVRRGAVAAERLRLLSIDLLLPVGRSAANPPHAAPAAERWDRQTVGRTLGRFTDPAPHTMPSV